MKIAELMLQSLNEHTPTNLDTLFVIAENHGYQRNSVKGAMYVLLHRHQVVRVATEPRSSYVLAPLSRY